MRLSSNSVSSDETRSSESHEEDVLDVEAQQQADVAPESTASAGIVGFTE